MTASDRRLVAFKRVADDFVGAAVTGNRVARAS